MAMEIKASRLELTPSFRVYAEKKLLPLLELAGGGGVSGQAMLSLSVKRVTRHQRKGEVFSATADLVLPKKVLCAESSSSDPRAAVDALCRKLRAEIKKHKTRQLAAYHGRVGRMAA